jgi:hypothetical protein
MKQCSWGSPQYRHTLQRHIIAPGQANAVDSSAVTDVGSIPLAPSILASSQTSYPLSCPQLAVQQQQYRSGTHL